MGGTEPGGAAPRPPWPGGAAWVDGRYCPIDEAKISVLDLAVTRSDRQPAGASMRVSQVVRIPSQSVDPSVKNYHWLDLDLALLEAYDHDADLVVLRDLSGAVARYSTPVHYDEPG